ncbi:hypothetical protein ACW5R3_04130 [Bizionia sp. KMM 8389]
MNEKQKEWANLEIKSFDKHQDLKRRLALYILSEYEENAIIDDAHLLTEFRYLKDNNQLNYLFRKYRVDY